MPVPLQSPSKCPITASVNLSFSLRPSLAKTRGCNTAVPQAAAKCTGRPPGADRTQQLGHQTITRVVGVIGYFVTEKSYAWVCSIHWKCLECIGRCNSSQLQPTIQTRDFPANRGSVCPHISFFSSAWNWQCSNLLEETLLTTIKSTETTCGRHCFFPLTDSHKLSTSTFSCTSPAKEDREDVLIENSNWFSEAHLSVFKFWSWTSVC